MKIQKEAMKIELVSEEKLRKIAQETASKFCEDEAPIWLFGKLKTAGFFAARATLDALWPVLCIQTTRSFWRMLAKEICYSCKKRRECPDDCRIRSGCEGAILVRAKEKA